MKEGSTKVAFTENLFSGKANVPYSFSSLISEKWPTVYSIPLFFFKKKTENSVLITVLLVVSDWYVEVGFWETLPLGQI